ncbi:MAG: hypothetical protein HQL40_11650 [Alphaproteobacteria bacterium]|nr:hypothetical protein [Alphaproteobacteria bacterium]
MASRIGGLVASGATLALTGLGLASSTPGLAAAAVGLGLAALGGLWVEVARRRRAEREAGVSAALLAHLPPAGLL